MNLLFDLQDLPVEYTSEVLLFISHSEVKQQHKSSKKETNLLREVQINNHLLLLCTIMLIQQVFPPWIYTFKQIIFAWIHKRWKLENVLKGLFIVAWVWCLRKMILHVTGKLLHTKPEKKTKNQPTPHNTVWHLFTAILPKQGCYSSVI